MQQPPTFDPNLKFDEGKHKYWLESDPDLKFTSATTFIDYFFKTFNAPKIAAKLVSDHPKYANMTVKELLRQWNQTGVHGTKVHYQIENYITDNLPINEVDEPKALHGIRWIEKTFDSDRHILYPEVRIYSKELQISGTVDLLAYDTEKDIYLLADWKTNKKIPRSSFNGETGTHPATFLVEDCKYNKYSLQMSLYRYMLEKEHGINIKRQILVHLYEGGIKPYFTPYMEGIIEEMIKECPLKK